MKKGKVLAMVLVAALMLSGIGYALWSDSIVLTSTAQTGKIDVDFVKYDGDEHGTCEERALAEVNELTQMDGVFYLGHTPPDAPDDENDDWNDALFTEDAIYFTVSNLYPQAKYELKYIVENNGTVPAILKGQVLQLESGDEDLFLQLKGSISTSDYNDILGVDGDAELVTSFVVPNWAGHAYEGKSCVIKITLNWEQVAVTDITSAPAV